MSQCPSHDDLQRLAVGLSDAESISEFATHLEACEFCRIQIEEEFARHHVVQAVRRPYDEPYTQTISMGSNLQDTIDDLSESPPTHLGEYVILSRLGRGGMGVVYLANDLKLHRQVAIKVIRQHHSDNQLVKRQFLHEARAAASLSHDNIVPVYQIGNEAGVPFIVMPVLKGETLTELLKREPRLDDNRIIAIGLQIAEGLKVAHKANLIHRDIKPSNIWLEPMEFGRFRVKILDFGLARQASSSGMTTHLGRLMGTPAFMAPEQARNAKLDHRCDLFSLGGVLYYMATGQLPFPGEDTLEVLLSLATQEPIPPKKLNPALSKALSDFILLLLRKVPDRRPQSAHDVINELSSIQENGLTASKPAMVSKRWGWLVGFAVLLFSVIALAVIYVPTRNGVVRIEVDDPNIRFQIDQQGFLIMGANQQEIRVTPGEHKLKFQIGEIDFETDQFTVRTGEKPVVKIDLMKGKFQVVQDGAIINEKEIAKNTTVRVDVPVLCLRPSTWEPGPKDGALPGLIPRPALRNGVGRWQVLADPQIGHPTFSPDGRWLASTGNEYTIVYELISGQPQHVIPHERPSLLITWSHDSQWFRVGDNTQIKFYRFDGTPSQLPNLPPVDRDYGWNPKYSLHASLLKGMPEGIQMIDPAKCEVLEVKTNLGIGGKMVWSPDGESFLVVRDDKTAQLFARDGKPLAKLAGNVEPTIPPAWNPTSTIVAIALEPKVIGLWKRDGTPFGLKMSHLQSVRQIEWHPNGDHLITSELMGTLRTWKANGQSVSIYDTKTDNADVIWSADGKGFFHGSKYWNFAMGGSFKLGENPNPIYVSPDRKRFFQTWRGFIECYDFRDGQYQKVGSTILQTGDAVPSWSLDGKSIAHSDVNGLTVYDATDPTKYRFIGNGFRVGEFHLQATSPQGEFIAIGSNVGHLWICNTEGHVLKQLANPTELGVSLRKGLRDLRWHPDGKRLVTVNGELKVTVYEVATGQVLASIQMEPRFAVECNVLFSPMNPDEIIISHPDQSAVWSWKLDKKPKQLFAGLGAVELSPDGKQLLAKSAGAGIHRNDFISPSLVTGDMKSFTKIDVDDLKGTPRFQPTTLIWHPDRKHMIAGGQSLSVRNLNGDIERQFEINIQGFYDPVVVSPDGSTLLFRIGIEYYTIPLQGTKPTKWASLHGTVRFTSDGKSLMELNGNSIRFWNFSTRGLERITLLLPNGEYAIFSPAGELLANSKQAEKHIRYVVEDKTGKLSLIKNLP